MSRSMATSSVLTRMGSNKHNVGSLERKWEAGETQGVFFLESMLSYINIFSPDMDAIAKSTLL